MIQYDFDFLYNLPYSPDLNGIEKFFSVVKNNYRKLLLKNLSFNENINMVEMAKEAFFKTDDKIAISCAKHGIEEIKKLG